MRKEGEGERESRGERKRNRDRHIHRDTEKERDTHRDRQRQRERRKRERTSTVAEERRDTTNKWKSEDPFLGIHYLLPHCFWGGVSLVISEITYERTSSWFFYLHFLSPYAGVTDGGHHRVYLLCGFWGATSDPQTCQASVFACWTTSMAQ